MNVSAIIVAGGKGARANIRTKKQFCKMHGKHLLYYAILPFYKISIIDEIIIVLPKAELKRKSNIIKKDFLTNDRFKFVYGGEKRADSVFNGLKIADNKTKIVCIHDGVRPFVKEGIILEVIKNAKKWGAAISGCNIVDTVKEVNKKGFILKTKNRDMLYCAHTPQAFDKELLYKFLVDAQSKGLYFTDEAALFENNGKKVYLVPDSYYNIKITTKEDLLLAEGIMEKITKQQGSTDV